MNETCGASNGRRAGPAFRAWEESHVWQRSFPSSVSSVPAKSRRSSAGSKGCWGRPGGLLPRRKLSLRRRCFPCFCCPPFSGSSPWSASCRTDCAPVLPARDGEWRSRLEKALSCSPSPPLSTRCSRSESTSSAGTPGDTAFSWHGAKVVGMAETVCGRNWHASTSDRGRSRSPSFPSCWVSFFGMARPALPGIGSRRSWSSASFSPFLITESSNGSWAGNTPDRRNCERWARAVFLGKITGVRPLPPGPIGQTLE